MIKTLVVVASGGALAFGLAGVASPAMALGSVAPAGVTQANPPMPGDPPIIRHSNDRSGGQGHIRLLAPSDPPIIRGSTARLGDPDDGGQVTQATARLGDPDDGGQVQVFAALGDPDDGGE